ncbi:helix-turn-helix domain-containing protein [Bradyrhizobium sp. 187]|uniref:AraC-like ligand-binding domain-containing protein n=1 Tax=Bradyrhizobium sp. 187 TaxID=2782655 RepID=UPI001FFFB9C0|nr:helix-turn-helix domain-containing protein [Bradyrhizobium sp. 187]UPJ76154.1 helix-turn-helix domain-containing protein [Bradyrhizobium sp. 187]
METIFSTRRIHRRDKFDHWHSVACKQIVDHDSRPEARLSFDAEVELGRLCKLELILFSNSPMQISHTAAHASRTKSDHVFVCRQLSGSVLLDQEYREITLAAGSVVLLDPLLPYSGKFLQDSKMLVVKVPRRQLEARLGKIRNMVTRLIPPARAQDRLTSMVMGMLPSLASQMNSISDQLVGNHVLDLIAVSLAKAVEGARPRVACSRGLLLLNIRAVIEARLNDRCLDPQTVADSVGVSVRYANQILEEHNTSLARLILARRLARCRCALEDPAQANRTISEIAYGWGFSDLTHFGRRFKQAYQILPREARALAKRPGMFGA